MPTATATSQYQITFRDFRRHPKALAFIRSKAKRRIARAGRRGGKTTGVAKLAGEAFHYDRRRILYATPTGDQIQKFWAEVKAIFAEPLDAGILIKNETMHTIEPDRDNPYVKAGLRDGTFDLNQRIRAKTAWNADTLRGDYADLLILDEWQLMDEEAWEVVGAPMLLDNNGDAVFIYTPPSLASKSVTKARDPLHAAKMFKRAQQDTTGRWGAFHWTSHDNPFISVEALADITLDMTALAIRQEIMAEDIDEVPGALWTRNLIESTRVDAAPANIVRIVIGVDPPGGATEAGIVVVGLSAHGHRYVLEDCSIFATPQKWAETVLDAYERWEADRVVAEENYGGDMVESTIRAAAAQRGISVSYKPVHATRGKAVRAEPQVAGYERGEVHHVGVHPHLEQEMVTWTAASGARSPNRLDACLIAGTAIRTSQGLIPIERIQIEDRVLTREGWRRVYVATQTSQSAAVYTVEFSNGTKLTGTGNHPIWVRNKGFVNLNTLVCGDIINTCSESPNTLNITASFIPAIQTALIRVRDGISQHHAGAAAKCYMWNYGNQLMGQCRQAITSITKTIILLIMTLIIWFVSVLKNMPLSTEKSIRLFANHGWLLLARWLRRGIAQTRAGNGIGNMLNRLGLTRKQRLLPAHGAGVMPRGYGEAETDHDSVAANVQGHWLTRNIDMRHTSPVQSAERSSGKTSTVSDHRLAPVSVVRVSASGYAPVWNLAVEGQPEYYANGVLVHNCVWAETELDKPGVRRGVTVL